MSDEDNWDEPEEQEESYGDWGGSDGDDNDDDDDDGDGEPKGQSIKSAMFCCCIGLLMWPGFLFVTGWNERRTVCREKAIIAAETLAEDLRCNDHSVTVAGAPIGADTLGFLQCGVDHGTVKNFTSADLGVGGMPQTVFGSGPGVNAIGISRTVQMYVCEETCARTECNRRRLRGEDEGDDEAAPQKEGDDYVVEDDAVDDFDERELTGSRRRASSQRGGSSRRRECTPQCVEWSYAVQLRASKPAVATWNSPMEAHNACGVTQNPTTEPLSLGTHTEHASVGGPKTVGGGWALNDYQIKQAPIDTPVTLTSSVAAFDSAVQPPAAIDSSTAHVTGNTISTCTTPTVGCMVINWQKSLPTTVVALGKVSVGLAQFIEPSVDEWTAPADWLCGSEGVSRFCPMYTSVSLTGGLASCGQDITREQLFDSLANENNTVKWFYRIGALLMIWLAVTLVCNPINVIVRYATDNLDWLASFIPCVGCIVDQLTDWFVGIVKALVCMISCFCAFSSFGFVFGITWAAMRPMVGIPILIVSLLCCCAGLFVAKTCKKNNKKSKREVELDDDE